MSKFDRPKAGLLLFASPRFKNLGADTGKTFNERKESEVTAKLNRLKEVIDLSFPGIIYGREDVEKAILKFLNEKVDLMIAEFLSWSEDFAWIRFLRDRPDLPVLFINTVRKKCGFINTEKEDDFINFLCSGGLVGSLEASGSLKRIDNKNSQIIIGNEEEILSEIAMFAKVSKVKKIFKSSTFGLLANYNEAMWSTYIDPYNIFAKIGPELRFISYSTWADEINAISDTEAEAYVQELTSKYQVEEGVDRKKLLESARASLGMVKIAQKASLDALVYNDIDPAMFNLIGLRAGFYHDWFNKNLSIVVPEADIGAGVITYLLKLLSHKHISFIEPFYIEEENDCFAAGHAGPNDHNDPRYTNKVKIACDVRFAKTSYKYAGAPFAWYRFPAGRKTMAHFSEYDGRYKLVCTLVDVLDGDHFITSYSHGVIKPLVPVKELFEKILNIGTTQHFSLVDGDYRRELKYFAKIMGFDYYNIG